MLLVLLFSLLSSLSLLFQSRAWTLSLGFSLAYGAMFSKTWRVHLIFTNKILKRKVIKDRHLFAVVCVLVIVDIIYLTVWQVTDPMTRTVREFPQESLDSDLDVQLVTQLELCESKETYRWLGILCGYKGLLLLFGAFLAWETRNVTIAALNDSKYIGMSVYNVFILCVIGAPISLAMREQPDASFSIASVCIIICTSITLCLVFIPKVLEMKKVLLSGDQLRRTFTSSALVLETNSIMPAVDIDTERQIIDLKRKINDKDKEIRELRLRLMNSAGVKHSQRIELKTTGSMTPIDTN